MQQHSPALEWALNERQRLAEKISDLSGGDDVADRSAELHYLKDRLRKIDALIAELESSQISSPEVKDDGPA